MKHASKRVRFVPWNKRAEHIVSSGEHTILVRSCRNMSIQSFELPFTGVTRVREALHLKFRPLLGENASAVSIVPFFARNERKISSGCVFMLRSDDGSERTPEYDHSIWPLPMLFASEIGGTGAIACKGDGIIASIVLKDWVPIYYTDIEDGTVSLDEAADEIRDVASALGVDVATVLAIDMDTVSEDDIQAHGERALSSCKAYEALDLSNKGADILERRENISSALMRAGKIALISGVLFSLCCAIIIYVQSTSIEKAPANAEEVYSISFGEASRQPLSSARAKLRSLSSGDGQEMTMLEILGTLSSAWDTFNDADITIENMRFGTENTDIMGTSRSNELIQRLRSHLENDGYSPRIDNVQQAPNGLLRFNISITRGTRQ